MKLALANRFPSLHAHWKYSGKLKNKAREEGRKEERKKSALSQTN